MFPNAVSPKDTIHKKLLNDLFEDNVTADTVSMTDDESMHSLHAHETDDEHSIDTHECNAVLEEDDIEEIMYEVPVPKIGDPKNKSLTPISICVIDTIGLVKT